MKAFFLLLIILQAFYAPIFSQTVPVQLDSFFNELNHYGQINGSVLIAEKGNILYQQSFGLKNTALHLPNTNSSAYTLASVSKIFTSTAILQLKEKNKLQLDDPFVKYFPEFPYGDITIRHLLSHTSGLPDYQLYEEAIRQNPGKIFTNKDVIPSLKTWARPLRFKPGEKWDYSNTNFCLLALLVEKISKTTFEQYLQRFIFKAANMQHTYFMNDPAQSGDTNRVINYEYPFLFSGELQNVDSLQKYHWRLYNASGFVGQGNIITNTTDMLAFDQALDAGRLLKPSTLEEAFVPAKLVSGKNADANVGLGKASYGLGWFIFTDSSAGKIVWHTGGQPGGLSIFLRNISKRQTVILFDNAFNRELYGNGVSAMDILNGLPVVTRKRSLSQQYGSALIKDGADAAFCKFHELLADSLHYYLSEDDMNELGLQLLYAGNFAGHEALSLEVLKLNILRFPDSFNTYDSYGEALAKIGKKESAIFMYKKSLELNPSNESGKAALQTLMKDNLSK